MTLLSTVFKKSQDTLVKMLEPVPQLTPPVVTSTDASTGYITRYFVRQVNDKDYIVEVDQKQYEAFKKNPRFITTSVKWKIIGKKETITLSNQISLYGVKDANKLAVSTADLTFGGLYRYITNYLEYWVAEEV